MRPEIENLRRQLRQAKEQGSALLRGVDEVRLKKRAGPLKWSVGECFSHMNIANGQYIRAIEKTIHKAVDEELCAKGKYRYGLLERLFLRMLEPPATWKVKAPEPFLPVNSTPREELLAVWEHTHDRLVLQVERSDDLDLKQKVKSPASGLFQPTLAMAFAVIAAHDRRHLRQAEKANKLADNLNG
jgi:DinB superfamily